LKANTHSHFRRFAQSSARLTLRVLRAQVAQAAQRLTTSGERMTLGARAQLGRRRDRFAGLEIRLKASKLANAQAQRNRIARDRERALRLAERARRALATAMQRQQSRIGHAGQLLTALSYKSVLTRGFALVRDQRGHAVRAAAAIEPGARLDLEFADGRIGATADADRPAVSPTSAQKAASSEPKPAAPRRVAKPVGQGSLF
jgi:exodeoxyribonuclease VII large subunit